MCEIRSGNGPNGPLQQSVENIQVWACSQENSGSQGMCMCYVTELKTANTGRERERDRENTYLTSGDAESRTQMRLTVWLTVHVDVFWMLTAHVNVFLMLTIHNHVAADDLDVKSPWPVEIIHQHHFQGLTICPRPTPPPLKRQWSLTRSTNQIRQLIESIIVFIITNNSLPSHTTDNWYDYSIFICK